VHLAVAVDLHPFLPAAFLSSQAMSIDQHGGDGDQRRGSANSLNLASQTNKRIPYAQSSKIVEAEPLRMCASLL
jgi:hypothetical protein